MIITDPREDVQKTGNAVLEIWNERYKVALGKHDGLRAAVLIRDMKDKEVETFEDLIEYATEVKQTMTHLKEMINALPTKVRNVQRDVKAKEKEFENARNAIKQLQKVSGF